MERNIQRDADFRIAVVEKDNEERIHKLQATINSLQLQLEEAKSELTMRQDEMRTAFLRGVSAMNQQALGMFKSESELKDVKMHSINLSKEINRQYSQDPITGTISAKKGLVTRHYPKAS